MKFSIITPTHKRSEQVKKAIHSVLAQDYGDWEMIVIIDSPDDPSYQHIKNDIPDPRVSIRWNSKNEGVNFSRNVGISAINPNTDWILFLDDDDFLAPRALSSLVRVIEAHPQERWIVTNRAFDGSGKLITVAPKSGAHYSYARDYLLLRRFKGDATHCISTAILNNPTAGTVRFPTLIKQAEEWLFFFSLGVNNKLFYIDLSTTLSDGYESQGLNYRKRKVAEEISVLKRIYIEGQTRRITRNVYFLAYFFLRIFRIISNSLS
jgi:glycosyltransferase involved in cell wall biosynthesis